eukprot:230118-Pelagomonas_calceolata.AAC.1
MVEAPFYFRSAALVGRSVWDRDQVSLLSASIRGYKGYKWVGLQPETLADRLLIKRSHPASKNETNSASIKVHKEQP